MVPLISPLAMARPLPSLSMQKLPFLPISVTFFFIVISVFSIFTLVTFLCASHKATKTQRLKQQKTIQMGDKKPISRLQSNISSKALLMVKMISWRKVQDEGEDEEYCHDDEEALWKRTIIMGERCRPLEFSGKIAYDADGNLLPDSPHPSNGK
ncbi:unnamed protein product [Ilex paraguariensis]|uniref:Transmembrane protein n=1 Tax=Ilex paraguariensis TaxID=185542 RepID=A0ABC8V0G4_9AQUA